MSRQRVARIQRSRRLAVLAVLLAPVAARAATVGASGSRIVEVTVYPDRAEVVREVRVELPAGSSSVEFAGIPFAVEPDSLRVTAKGVPAVLGAVEIRERAEAPRESAEQLALRKEVKRIEWEIARIGAQERVAGDLREFLNSLRAATSQRESSNLGAGKADPAAVQGFYDLLAAKLAELGEQDLARRGEFQKLSEEIEVARAKLSAGPPAGSIRSRVASVEVEAQQAGTLTLRLAYLAPGASWRPSYRATLDAATGEVSLVSEGVVRQKTGEDWTGVTLRLSTSAPARGVAPPEMTSLLLRPVDESEMKDRERASRVSVLGGATGGVMQNVLTAAPEDADGGAANAPSEALQAGIVRSAYNVAFEVPGRSEVPADGADHRVVLRQEVLPGTLAYRAAPAIEPAAFLTSVVRSPGQYPLLQGPMRVLASGAYLGVYGLPETAPGAELTIPFGRDNRIKVDRVRLPEERGTEGLTGKTRQIAYEYRTTLENLRDREVTVTLEDRIPVSEDERIVVEMEKATTPGHQESKYRPGVLLWKLTLAPREKKNVVLAYSVRFPKDMVVPGLW